MASFKTVMKSGHPPTLFAAFLYFDFCFAIWVLNGAMGPFITETYKLTQTLFGSFFEVAHPMGAATPTGLLLHTVVFFLAMLGLMMVPSS